MTRIGGRGLRGCAPLAASIAVMVAAGGAHADGQGPQGSVLEGTAVPVAEGAPAPQLAQVGPAFRLDIPAKPLLAALADFTAATGVQVVQQSAQGLSGTSAPVSGTLTAGEALARLLGGTGFVHRMTGPGTAVIERVEAQGAVLLDPVMVQGQSMRGGGAGPVDGYVASAGVGGTKTDTPLVETPQSITVVPRRQIEDQGSQTVMQALRYTPGAFTGQVGASNRYDYVILRGFTDRSIENTYLDGLKLMGDDSTYSSMQVDPYFLERIEAIRGPSSVLYGRSSPGGLIAMTSKKPLFEPHAEVEATIGTRDQRGAGFDVGGPLGESGNLAYRLVGLADAADTQYDHAKEKRYAIAPSFTAELGEDSSLTLMGYFQHDPEGGTHNGVPAEGTLFARNGRFIERGFFDGEPGRETFERTQRMVGYQFEHRFDDRLSVRQNLRYLDSDVRIDQIYQIGWAGQSDLLSRYYGGGDESLQALTVDNQAQLELSTGPLRHTLLAGLDYQHRRTKNDWTFGSAASIDAFAPVYGSDGVTGAYGQKNTRRLNQIGVYLQDQIALDRWRLSFGGRYDWVETANLNRLTDVEKGENRGKLTGRAGLLYLFDSGLAPYASWSQSFSPNLYTGADGNPLEPTTGVQYEAGVKYQPPRSESLVSAALFHIEQDNVAVADPNTFVYRPVGTIRSRGLELEGRLQVTETFALLAGYSYTDVVYKTSPNGKEGNRPPQIPKHMASLWGSYGFTEGALENLTLGAGLRVTGRSWADSLNTRQVPAHAVIDASLRYGLGALGLEGTELRVNANNLLNKSYIASCLELANCYFGEGRSVTATLSHRF
ncbi:TonB-dependent siderophore receptor [Azospirillum sp. SYSU D00513]|uniref:TonB-dependent siderophore receptor n=1 Tax=Azospirillum sp. SYSU D00513 TaxID=2812561 RepID=UPI001A96E972|nr:TonB-dependent siderophore receptor [Azospirillum sp. SYSU D00513]